MKIAGVVILVLVLSGGAILYLLNSNPASAPTSQTNPQPETKSEASESAAPTAGYGSYREYAKDSFEVNAGKKTRMLFFYADWCPTCRPVDADIKANLDKIPGDTEIIKVNYNDDFTDADEKALAAKYGITYQHTFVQIDSAGNEVTKWNGGDWAKLLKHIQEITVVDGPKQPATLF